MSFKFDLPVELDNVSINKLSIPDGVLGLLEKDGIKTYRELYEKLQADELVNVTGIGKAKTLQIAQALKNESTISKSQFLKFFFCWSQLIFYFSIAICILAGLQIGIEKFNQDEIAVISFALFAMLAFDSGRAVRRRSYARPLLPEFYLRTVVVLLSIPLSLALTTRKAWEHQEILRVLACSLLVVLMSSVFVFVYVKYFAIEESGSRTQGVSQSLWHRLRNAVRNPKNTGAVAIVCATIQGGFALLAAILTLVGGLLFQLFNQQ